MYLNLQIFVPNISITVRNKNTHNKIFDFLKYFSVLVAIFICKGKQFL